MWHDPHEQHNPNFSEDLWREYLRNAHVSELATGIKKVIESGRVAVVKNIVLSALSFDTMSIVDYPAVILQMGYHPWRSSLAISRMVHAKYEEPEDVTRFCKSESMNPPMYPPNIIFVSPPLGRGCDIAMFKKQTVVKPTQMSLEF